MINHRFRLFVAGESARSIRAAESLRSLIDSAIPGEAEVTVIDVLQRPDLAEEFGILATPVVIRDLPLPQRRVVGDLSDPVRVADALGIDRTLRRVDKDWRS